MFGEIKYQPLFKAYPLQNGKWSARVGIRFYGGNSEREEWWELKEIFSTKDKAERAAMYVANTKIEEIIENG